jgi:hypothetical protein
MAEGFRESILERVRMLKKVNDRYESILSLLREERQRIERQEAAKQLAAQQTVDARNGDTAAAAGKGAMASSAALSPLDEVLNKAKDIRSLHKGKQGKQSGERDRSFAERRREGDSRQTSSGPTASACKKGYGSKDTAGAPKNPQSKSEAVEYISEFELQMRFLSQTKQRSVAELLAPSRELRTAQAQVHREAERRSGARADNSSPYVLFETLRNHDEDWTFESSPQLVQLVLQHLRDFRRKYERLLKNRIERTDTKKATATESEELLSAWYTAHALADLAARAFKRCSEGRHERALREDNHAANTDDTAALDGCPLMTPLPGVSRLSTSSSAFEEVKSTQWLRCAVRRVDRFHDMLGSRIESALQPQKERSLKHVVGRLKARVLVEMGDGVPAGASAGKQNHDGFENGGCGEGDEDRSSDGDSWEAVLKAYRDIYTLTVSEAKAGSGCMYLDKAR